MLPRKTLVIIAALAAGLNAQAQLRLQVSNQPNIPAQFQSLEQARNAIREMKVKGTFPAQGVVVEIRGGVYPVRDTFELTREDAGLPGAPVVYRAFENEQVVVSGGRTIPFSKFEKVSVVDTLARLVPEVRGKVVVADLSKLGITDFGEIKQQGFSTPILPAHLQIYGNGELFELAKWPNEGSLKIGRVLDPGAKPFNELHGGVYQNPKLMKPNYIPRGGTFEFDYDRADRWKQASDIWLEGVFAVGFAHDNLKVKSIDFDKRTITTAQPHMFAIEGWADTNPMTKSRHYAVYNLLEELDCPGEYYLDNKSGRLYLIPRENTSLESIEITITEKPFIAIENTAHIRLEGITLEYGRGMGIYMENSENVVLDKLTVRGFGTLGMMMGQGVEGGPDGPVHEFTGTPVSRHVGNIKAHQYENSTWNRKAGRNCVIQNCKIYDTGQGGVIIDGGSRTDLSPGNNQITNCNLYRNSNLRKSYSPAVSVYGVGNAVRNCHIHDQPHNAVTIFGNDHTIEHNEIDHILQGEFDDMGAFYMGRNPSEMGNRIVGNYFHHIKADESRRVAGVYLDDGAGGSLIASNVFYKVGSPKFGAVFMHFGHSNTIEKNVFIDCPTPGVFSLNTKRWEIQRKTNLWKKRLFEDINISRPPYSTHYPALKGYLEVAKRINTARSNLIVNCARGFVAEGGPPEKGGFLLEGNQSEIIEIPAEPFGLEVLGASPLGKLMKQVCGLSAVELNKMGSQEKPTKGAQ